MRKAALLYNPDSGGSQQRQRELESALAVLRGAGVEADLVAPRSRDHAEDEVRAAIDSGCDTIFACGGDGTIHNIIQVLANSPVALAVLPMGTANALAHDIGLPLNVVNAAKAALTAVPRRIALGRVAYSDLQGNSGARYFVVAAGIGVDAHLFYKLHTGIKQRMGMAAYYAKAWNLWFTYAMPRFVAEYVETGSDAVHRSEVTELLAVRIRKFGGVVRELAPGASLDRDDIRLVCCRSSSRRGLSRLRDARPAGRALDDPGRRPRPQPARHLRLSRAFTHSRRPPQHLHRSRRRTAGHAPRRNHSRAGRLDPAGPAALSRIALTRIALR